MLAQNSIKYKQLDRFDDLERTGRPKQLSGRLIHYLKRLVKWDSRPSTSKIANGLEYQLTGIFYNPCKNR